MTPVKLSNYTAPDSPFLDLTTVDENELKEAITGFIVKNLEHKGSVRIKDIDGVVRYIMPDLGKLATHLFIESQINPRVYAGDGDRIKVTDITNVQQTFLDLCEWTCPHGHEYNMYDETLQELGFVRNGRGNYWLTVGDGTSKTLFVAHIDTADHGKPKKVNITLTADNWAKTDGTTVLGADDRAGMAVLLYMIHHKVPGDYLLVIGEERGCVGSSEEAKHIPQGKYDRAIQFDRNGHDEIITHQVGRRTASKVFARALGRSLRKASKGRIDLKPSDRGVYTDTNEFTNIIKECTNIAIGYLWQHSERETQDLGFLKEMAEACVEVAWDTLPTVNEYSGKHATSRYAWFYDSPHDAEVEDEAPEIPWDEAGSLGVGTSNMWEMWANIDNGEWTLEELRRWVIFNPAKAAAIIKEHIDHDGVHSLDTLTRVEMG